MESSPLWCKVPGMGGRGLSGTAHPGLRAQLPFQVPHPPFPSPFHQQLYVTKSPFSLRFMALHSWKMPRSLEKKCDLCALAVPTWWECTGSQDPALGVGDPAVIWFIWLSSLLTLLEGLRLTHFLLRSFLLPCQLFEFKPSLCSSSPFRVYTMWCLPWLKGIIANAAQHNADNKCALPRAIPFHTFHIEDLELGEVSYRLWKAFQKIPLKV